ncbi:MAG: YbjN domain-containing protein [Pseudanabaenales cyanobacterium]|nr:YbjN domain-containing protein [Pseudanabaenales cyanobacterium]
MNRTISCLLWGGAIAASLVGEVAFESFMLAPAQAQVQLAQSRLTLMTAERLEDILSQETHDFRAENGQWLFTFEGRPMIALVDAAVNRMRIVAPIMAAENLTNEQIQSILLANFHTTLDGRYAVTNGTVVATFAHPLSSLQENDLQSALHQVAQLAENFGSTYSSGELLLRPGGQPQPQNSQEGSLEI